MPYTIRPLTPDRWPALEDLFGPRGACNGCWCMYWRIGNAYTRRDRDVNKTDFHRIVAEGPPPGLLAFDGDLAVGWCQVTPRETLPWLQQSRHTRAVDDAPVWAISCFYVRRGYRRQGVTAALVSASIKAARRARAPAIEAYPREKDATTSGAYTGVATVFERAGFRTLSRPTPQRRVMRLDLA